MTAIDKHIIELLGTLSEDGKEVARKMLGKSKKKKKSNEEFKKRLRKNLFPHINNTKQ